MNTELTLGKFGNNFERNLKETLENGWEILANVTSDKFEEVFHYNNVQV